MDSMIITGNKEGTWETERQNNDLHGSRNSHTTEECDVCRQDHACWQT